MLFAQEYKTVKFEQIHTLMETSNDTLYIVNFWATWCKPCVEELPYFEKAYNNFANEKVKIILVSLDFQHEIETKFKGFLRERNLQNEIWYLDEKKFSKFIPKLDSKWSGALPFTLFFRGTDGLRHGMEGAFEEGSLNKKIREFIK